MPTRESPAQVTAVSGGEALVRALEDERVELLFGIPGTHSLPIYRALERTAIRHVTPRHEQGGGYAADGYARAGGRAGVLLATTGPGVLNAATPAATAWADSIPMLILSPSLPTDVEGRDTGFLHETKDQRGAMDSVTAWSHRASSPSDAYRAVRRAFAQFADARPRPVHVEVPLDVMEAVEALPGWEPEAGSGGLDDDAVTRAVELLGRAQRVSFVLGGGARGAQAPLTALAERLGAAVLTTVNGKGVVSERHPLSLGASVRLRAAQDRLARSDVVLAVGTELGESDLWGPPPELEGELIRIDVDADQLDKNARSSVAILGDSAAAAAALLAGLGAADAGREPPDLGPLRASIEAEALRDGAPWVELCAGLERALGEDGLLAADSAMAAYHGAVHLIRLDGPGRLLYPTGYATLGYALPAALGAKLACPDKPVIALTGDGGLLFTVAELTTAAELGLSLPVVVPNNGGYGEIRRQMLDAQIAPVGVDLAVPDLPALAVACGGRGERLSGPDQLPSALDRALEQAGPTLIELPYERPRGARSTQRAAG